MTLADIYSQFTPGSQGFCTAVSDHCGFEISRDEIRRIAERAATAEQFEAAWEGDDWWTDANNSAGNNSAADAA